MIILIDALSTKAECNKYECLNLPEITEGEQAKLFARWPGQHVTPRPLPQPLREQWKAVETRARPRALSSAPPHLDPHASAHAFKVRLTLALLRSRRCPEDMSPYVHIVPESVL
jgi:hypothetical protein